MTWTGRTATVAAFLAVGGADALLLSAWDRRPGLWGRVELGLALLVSAAVLVFQAVALRRYRTTMRRQHGSLAAARKAMVRDQILADMGTGLLTAADPVAVHHLAVDGAAALCTESPDALAVVLVPDADDLVVVAAAGTELDGADVGLIGRRVAPPAELRARLLTGEVIGIGSVAELGVPGVSASRSALVMPLVVNGRFFGVLVATADQTLRSDIRRALETLRTQVALALDAVALTAELKVRALHDPLTGLGNRALIGERLAQALARARRTGRRVGVLLLDLNGFKLVNDTLGHEAGDELLRAVAARLTHSTRLEDTVGRLGGDEFVIVAEDLHDLSGAVRIAERVVASIDAPILIEGRRLPVTVSVGVALGNDASTPDSLIRHADAAMYTAKRRKSGAYHIYTTPAAA